MFLFTHRTLSASRCSATSPTTPAALPRVTTNHVLGIEVVLDDGQIGWLGAEVPDTPGYDLCGVFVGSEGTMGIVTKVAVRLMQTRESVRTLLAIFDRMEPATETVVDITAVGIIPAALEMMDRLTIEAVERGAPVVFLGCRGCASRRSRRCPRANRAPVNLSRNCQQRRQSS